MKKFFLGLMMVFVASEALASGQGDYYVRVDMGYGQVKLKNINSSGKTELNSKGTGFVGSLGFGHNIYDNFRTEVQIYYDDGLKAKSNGAVSRSRRKTMAGLFNVACDLMPSSAISPYIIGGLGYGQTRSELTKGADTYKSTKKGKRGAVFQGGAGLAYKLTEDFVLDLSYRLMSPVGSAKKTCADVSGSKEISCKSSATQVLLGGVRYSF
jgi:opacity protein-like surface antigen